MFSLFPYTTLFRSSPRRSSNGVGSVTSSTKRWKTTTDRKSTRLNSSHVSISYAVFCLKKKKTIKEMWLVRQKIAKEARERRRRGRIHGACQMKFQGVTHRSQHRRHANTCLR